MNWHLADRAKVIGGVARVKIWANKNNPHKQPLHKELWEAWREFQPRYPCNDEERRWLYKAARKESGIV